MPYDAAALVNSINNPTMHAENKNILCYADRFKIKCDKDWSARQTELYIYKLFQNARIYDNLQPWYAEYSGESYTPLVQRKPSVIYNMPKIIVDESVSMLFGEEHFPIVRCEDEKTMEYLQYITRACGLRYSMLAAARTGAIGSVCIVVKVLESKFYFDVLPTVCLEPEFSMTDPGKLKRLVERKKVTGEVLLTHGYAVEERNYKKTFWVVREWNEEEEIYYEPVLVDGESIKYIRDEKRSSRHELGFVPAVWIKNSAEICQADGLCTFEPAIDISIELNYQLSQLGRLLRYNSDPTMVVKNPSSLQGEQLIKGSGVLELDEKGDAYMVEMKGNSAQAVLDYAHGLREYALESVRGNRANPDKLGAIQSGKALQMLNAPLISLVDEFRLCYGDYGLMKVYIMALRIVETEKFKIDYGEYAPGNIEKAIETMRLDWPDWYPPTPQDNMQESQSLTTLTKGMIISRATALKKVSDKYGVVDEKKELGEIEQDAQTEAALNAKEMPTSVAVKSGGTTNKPKSAARRRK